MCVEAPFKLFFSPASKDGPRDMDPRDPYGKVVDETPSRKVFELKISWSN
jgi:hypothetical protein